MMKCQYCGAPLDLDDNFCSHCGKLNEQVKQHVDDMNRFKSEFTETKEEVYETTKRYTGITVRVVVIAFLFALNVMVAVVSSNFYSFRRMANEMDCNKHFEEYSAILDGYLAAGDYQSFYIFITEKDVPYYDSEYEQYAQLYYLVSQYIWIYDYLIDASLEEDVAYRESLATYALDNIEYFYDNIDPENYYYYKNITREENVKAIEDLCKKIEMLLVTYGNLSPEDAAQFSTYSSAKRAMLLEEGLQYGK